MINLGRIFFIILALVFAQADLVLAQVMKCYTKNEVGEISIGQQYIFERTNDLNKNKPSIIDFDRLKIINADTGSSSPISRVADNFYVSTNDYKFLTNDDKTITLEVKFDETAGAKLIYSKILFCEKF